MLQNVLHIFIKALAKIYLKRINSYLINNFIVIIYITNNIIIITKFLLQAILFASYDEFHINM